MLPGILVSDVAGFFLILRKEREKHIFRNVFVVIFFNIFTYVYGLVGFSLLSLYLCSFLFGKEALRICYYVFPLCVVDALDFQERSVADSAIDSLLKSSKFFSFDDETEKFLRTPRNEYHPFTCDDMEW